MERPHRVLRHSLCTDGEPGEPVHIDGAALLVVEPHYIKCKFKLNT